MHKHLATDTPVLNAVDDYYTHRAQVKIQVLSQIFTRAEFGLIGGQN